MKIVVQPETSFTGEPVSIRVTEAPPGSEIVLAASTTDARGHRWSSQAVFRADAGGVVDPAGQAPMSGDYDGVDPSGLLWSMRSPGDLAFRAPWDKLEIGLTATARVTDTTDGAAAPSVVSGFTRRVAASGMRRVEVREAGLTATFFEAPGAGRKPGLLCLHGSGGGIAGLEPVGALLASKGFSSLVAGYFDVPGLPKNVCEVPLEALAAGVKWLKANPAVDPDRVGALGTSVGGEAVLAMASLVEGLDLKAVVAVSPSHVVWQALAEGPPPMKPRWTLNGKALPFVPMRNDRLMGPMISFLLGRMFRRPSRGVRTLAAYEAGLLDPHAAERAAIPVERIKCPVLLVAGQDDQVWPSPWMIEQAMRRRAAVGGFVSDSLFTCPDAGHMTIHVPNVPTTVRLGGGGFLAFGGTARGDAAAAADAWRRIPEFLKLHLG